MTKSSNIWKPARKELLEEAGNLLAVLIGVDELYIIPALESSCLLVGGYAFWITAEPNYFVDTNLILSYDIQFHLLPTYEWLREHGLPETIEMQKEYASDIFPCNSDGFQKIFRELRNEFRPGKTHKIHWL